MPNQKAQAKEKSKPRAAVLYDFLQVQGGAEAVTLRLCQDIEDLDLICAFVDKQAFPELPIDAARVLTLMHQAKLPGWLHFATSRAFQTKTQFLDQYETLIFSGAFAPLAVHNSKATRNIYYCHTPPRFAYDLKEFYLNTMPTWQRPLFKALIAYTRPRYEEALQQMDVVYANSKNTQSRIKRFCGIDSQVLYPPCNTNGFEWLSQGDYFLSTARLEPYKRVDVIIDVFKAMPDKKLIVTSGGSQLEVLKQRAEGAYNITFTGWVSAQELRQLVGNCLATIYIPRDEDFGISPVQSMAAGKPVIGVKEGGLIETVIHGETGWLLESDLAADALIEVLRGASRQRLMAMRDHCEHQAFGFDRGFAAELNLNASE